jgi:hypothetical protein
VIRRVYKKNHPGLPRPHWIPGSFRLIYAPKTEGTICVYREREPYERKKPES